jgi:hypothetical protein
MARRKNGALLFGTLVLLLNIYIIKHVAIFKLAIINVKYSKYIYIYIHTDFTVFQYCRINL